MMGESRVRRGAKTVFFLFVMTLSLLVVCAPPLLIAILDIVVPSTLLYASFGRGFFSSFISSQIKSYDFRASIMDVPLVSVVRSLLVLCAYSVWVGRGPYLGISLASNLISIGFVLAKAMAVFGGQSPESVDEGLMAALLFCSLALAMAHMLVAYKTSCKERRKLLVYRIDIEAVPVSSYKGDFSYYQKNGGLHR